eukprot:364915-Chlamydomonas_euryale.AAC.12
MCGLHVIWPGDLIRPQLPEHWAPRAPVGCARPAVKHERATDGAPRWRTHVANQRIQLTRTCLSVVGPVLLLLLLHQLDSSVYLQSRSRVHAGDR